MERLFSAPVVVAFWGLLNALMVFLLIGFLASGFRGGYLLAEIYGSAVGLVFLLAVLVWLARRRRRRGLDRGLAVPVRPASALLVAVGFTLVWLGLAFGMWLPILAAFPLAGAALTEFYARRGPRK